jgi:hypothetical protein
MNSIRRTAERAQDHIEQYASLEQMQVVEDMRRTLRRD